MVAVRKIKQGEIILTENPLMVLSKNKVNKNKGPSLLEQFENLSKPNQAKVLKLHHENPEADLEAKLENIFESNTIEVAPANCVALYPTIPRINHSCCPNVVWSWVKGSQCTKQVRATRSISAGEELCANYIDSFEGTFSSWEQRQVSLEHWRFVCKCEVCNLGEKERKKNDQLREKIRLQHQLVPKFMQHWKVEKAVTAAKCKLEMIRSLKNEMMSTLPSALLELYEMQRLAKVMNRSVEDDSEELLKEAFQLSQMLGDRFLHVYYEKLKQVEEECADFAGSKSNL